MTNQTLPAPMETAAPRPSMLARYEAARTALAEAHRVDEVKDIRDKAEAMAAYARQAKDTELIQHATEIKVRAERRCGELTMRMVKAQGRRTDITLSDDATKLKAEMLADAGLTRQEASRYEALAAMPDEHFETAVATAKATAGEVTTAHMLRAAKAARPQGKPMQGKKAQAMRKELQEAKEKGVSMLCTYARLTLSAITTQEEFTEEERELLDKLLGAIHQLQRSVSA